MDFWVYWVQAVTAGQQEQYTSPPGKTTLKSPLLALHAVEDETEEDEGIVAVVNFHIFHHPLTHLSEVTGFRKLALVHKASPRSNGHTALVDPFLSHTG